MEEDTIDQKPKPTRYRRWPLVVGIALGIVLTLAGILVILGTTYFQRFATAAQLSLNEVRQMIARAESKKDSFSNRKINLLLIGLDRRDDKLEHTLLTDSLIFASLDTGKASLTLIPIPRDLWISSLKTKVNALYYYGEISQDTTGPAYLENQLGQIISQKTDYWLLLNYQDLTGLVDALGGVDVQIGQGFEDQEYPNPAYQGESPDIPQYITVSFSPGLNHLDGARVLEFVRSRSSSNSDEGNDLARSSRQVLLFKEMVAKIKSRQVLLDPQRLGLLYRFWKDKIQSNLTDEDLLAILIQMVSQKKADLQKGIKLSQVEIPATYEQTGAILVHPPTTKYGQWVWEPESGNWDDLQNFIKNAIQ